MIGILGGTFDPPHLGHLKIAEYLLDTLPLEKIIFIPCYLPVLKESPHANSEHRLAMVNLLIKDNPKLELDDREIKKAQPSYTIDTLKSIRQEIGYNMPLAFIMGSDAFNQFLCWKDWQGILKLAHLIIVSRLAPPASQNPQLIQLLGEHRVNKAEELMSTAAGKIFLCDFPKMDVSSTEVREKIGKSIKEIENKLLKEVLDYILKHSLYQN